MGPRDAETRVTTPDSGQHQSPIFFETEMLKAVLFSPANAGSAPAKKQENQGSVCSVYDVRTALYGRKVGVSAASGLGCNQGHVTAG